MYVSTKFRLNVSRDFRNVVDFSFFVLFIIWKFKALAGVDINFLSWMPFGQQASQSVVARRKMFVAQNIRYKQMK